MLKNTKQTFTSFTTKKPSGVQANDAALTQGLDNDIIIRAARGEAMGLEVIMNPVKGPCFPEPLTDPSDLSRLSKKVDVEKELGYVYEAIKLTRKELEGSVPLIGFCGAPWTLMAYMIEGGGSKGFEKAKSWLYKYPEQSKELLQRITDVCCDHLVLQIKSGAQLLQVFDSWAGELSPHLFRTFSLPYLKQISSSVRDSLSCSSHPCVPLIIFAKGAGHSLPDIAKAGYDVLALDHTIEPSMARNVVEKVSQGSVSYSKSSGENELTHRLALQGNLDPSVLLSGKEAIEREVERMLKSKKGGFGGSGGYIAGLGGGVPFNADPESVKTFLKAVHRMGREVATAHDEE